VAYAKREWDLLSPSTRDGVEIRRANTASVDSDINVILFELLQGNLKRSVSRLSIAW
jgi:hypothetical protein